MSRLYSASPRCSEFLTAERLQLVYRGIPGLDERVALPREPLKHEPLTPKETRHHLRELRLETRFESRANGEMATASSVHNLHTKSLVRQKSMVQGLVRKVQVAENNIAGTLPGVLNSGRQTRHASPSTQKNQDSPPSCDSGTSY